MYTHTIITNITIFKIFFVSILYSFVFVISFNFSFRFFFVITKKTRTLLWLKALRVLLFLFRKSCQNALKCKCNAMKYQEPTLLRSLRLLRMKHESLIDTMDDVCMITQTCHAMLWMCSQALQKGKMTPAGHISPALY